MNIGEGVQAVEDLKFTEWFEQWQRLVLSGRDGQQHVVYQKTNGNTLIDDQYHCSFNCMHNCKGYKLRVLSIEEGGLECTKKFFELTLSRCRKTPFWHVGQALCMIGL